MMTIAHGKPALQSIFTHDATASTASRPNVRDDGQRPSLWDETARLIVLICPTGQEEYFPQGDWTGQITLKGFGKFAAARSPQDGDLLQVLTDEEPPDDGWGSRKSRSWSPASAGPIFCREHSFGLGTPVRTSKNIKSVS